MGPCSPQEVPALMATPKPVIVIEGNAAAFEVEWFDMAGEPATPASVRYQVFDVDLGSSVGPLTTVGEVAQTMEITVPGSHMPAVSTGWARRRLMLQVEGSFASGDRHTAFHPIYVQRRYALG